MKRRVPPRRCSPPPRSALPRRRRRRRSAAPGRPAQRDWTQTVARTPEGGFRMGNPNAPVKVVEYLSLTCPHCAAFAHEGGAAADPATMSAAAGSASNIATIMLNGVDIAAALLSPLRRAARIISTLTDAAARHPAAMDGPGARPSRQAQRDAAAARCRRCERLQRLVAMLGLDRDRRAPRRHRRAGARMPDRPGQSRPARRAAPGGRARSASTGTPTFFINGADGRRRTPGRRSSRCCAAAERTARGDE